MANRMEANSKRMHVHPCVSVCLTIRLKVTGLRRGCACWEVVQFSRVSVPYCGWLNRKRMWGHFLYILARCRGPGKILQMYVCVCQRRIRINAVLSAKRAFVNIFVKSVITTIRIKKKQRCKQTRLAVSKRQRALLVQVTFCSPLILSNLLLFPLKRMMSSLCVSKVLLVPYGSRFSSMTSSARKTAGLGLLATGELGVCIRQHALTHPCTIKILCASFPNVKFCYLHILQKV